MKIVSFVKHVPASAVMPRIASSGTQIDEEGLSHETNETDLYALEEALYQRSLHQGSVTAITVGPVRAKDALYLAYAKGVDHAVHVIDETFRGTNPVFNVRAAAEIARRMQADVLLTGIQADDDLQGQFGVSLAEALCLPVITAASEVRLDAARRTAAVIRELGAGFKEELEIDLPCVLTIQFGIRPIRYTPVMSIVKARSRKIEAVSGETLPISPNDLQPGARVRVVEFFYPLNTGNCELIGGSAEEAAHELLGKLVDEGAV